MYITITARPIIMCVFAKKIFLTGVKGKYHFINRFVYYNADCDFSSRQIKNTTLFSTYL